MYTGRDYSPAQVTESMRYGLDFVRDIAQTDIITSAVWNLSVLSGTDPTPNSHLVGAPALATPAGTTRQTATVQRIAGLLPNVLYTASAVVGTAQGDIVELFTHIQGITRE